MTADGGRTPAEPAAVVSLGRGAFAPSDAIGRVKSHSRFRDAVQHLIEGANELYDGNGLLNRAVNDRGRFVGGMIALYLHFCSVSETGEPGFSVQRFQAVCVHWKLCSFGRARALLTLMRFAGYLAPVPSPSDRRQRRLAPTEQLIELQRRRLQYQLEAIAFVSCDGRRALAVCDRPEFVSALLRHLGRSYAAGFRLLDYAPELSRLAESNAGLLLVMSLFLSAADGMTPDGMAVPVSVSALAGRFGVARAHVRKLLADSAAAGLVRRTSESTTVIVLPRCIAAVGNFLATLFALLAHCAHAAAEEIGSGSNEPSGSDTVLQIGS